MRNCNYIQLNYICIGYYFVAKIEDFNQVYSCRMFFDLLSLRLAPHF